jgi:hypothetical protein
MVGEGGEEGERGRALEWANDLESPRRMVAVDMEKSCRHKLE